MDFLNSYDEQEVYDKLGLTDEENAVLGYGGTFVIDPAARQSDQNSIHNDG